MTNIFAPRKRRRWTWKKGNQYVTGTWSYNWAADVFFITLEEPDPVSGRQYTFKVYGDHPEFNGFKLMQRDLQGRFEHAPRV